MKRTSRAFTPSKPRPDRRPISVRRWWGNGDVEATVKLTRAKWRRICAGEQIDAPTWAWYEGKRERVGFRFNHPERGDLYIGGGDCTDHYHGTIAEAQITGAEFPPRQPNATEFTVRDIGTLEMAGITLPDTRAEAYDLSASSITNAKALVSAAMDCQPLSWHLEGEYRSARADAVRAPHESWASWLNALPPDALESILEGVQLWLREEPNWAQEDDYIPQSTTGQGAALNFFRDWDPDDLSALGIEIVEGEHPGSSYYAAALSGAAKSANLNAWLRGLPVWFRAS